MENIIYQLRILQKHKIKMIKVFFTAVLAFSLNAAYAQSKKKQIIEKDFIIDSCLNVISNQKLELALKQNRISELEQNQKNERKKSEEKDATINELRTLISDQKSALTAKQGTITELEKSLFEEQKILAANTIQIKSLSEKIESQKRELDSIQHALPAEVNFKFEIINKAENQDERFGTDSQIKIYPRIGNQIIDTYSDFGDTTLVDGNQHEFYLSSEFSDKYYQIIPISPTRVFITRWVHCFDCDIQDRYFYISYLKSNSGIWEPDNGSLFDETND